MSENIWGYSLHITLQQCDSKKIRDGKFISNAFNKIVNHVEMTAYGETQLIHFGKDPKVTGYSAILFLEESNLTGHFVEGDDSAHIDLFSCKEFKPTETAKYVKKIFKAKSVSYSFLKRGHEISLEKLENNI